jgi:hypothetical protein
MKVPELYKQIASGKLRAVGRGAEPLDEEAKTPGTQQLPSLFDFARKRADVMLMNISPR